MPDADRLRGRIDETAAPASARLEALASLAPPPGPGASGEVNNHIHTCYSYSPYTPAGAALRALEAGLEVAGSVDHDSIAAAGEMREACALLGLGSVTGAEIRVAFKAAGEPGRFEDRKINSPDSKGIAYMTIQGVPARSVPSLDAYLAPIRARRLARTEAMCDAADAILAEAGFPRIDFVRDVLGRSKAAEGGGLTERHLLQAVAEAAMARFGRGAPLAEGLASALGLSLPPRAAALVGDPGNPYLVFDLLGVLKAGFLDRVFIQPDAAECPPAAEAAAMARSIGAVPAYAYLGDVAESPTGDKKAERFEDSYLEALFEEIARLGFLAVTYMPPRNSRAQLLRVRNLCAGYGLMEISGVDINQPRQSFGCPELRLPEFAHLVESTWALAAHEALASVDPKAGLFSPEGPLAGASLPQRLAAYAAAGRLLEPHRPGRAADLVEALHKDGHPK